MILPQVVYIEEQLDIREESGDVGAVRLLTAASKMADSTLFANMAAQVPDSHSPRQTLSSAYAFGPVTPIHSPHHSLASTSSSRTPIHQLSLHEYRKQQNTPTAQTATPPGKTLRRKAAASSLNELERVPSISGTPRSGSRPRLRPSLSRLHLAQTARQLSAHPQLPPSPPHVFEYSDVPNQQLDSYSVGSDGPGPTGHQYTSTSEAEHSDGSFNVYTDRKVSYWKPIKRLPKPTTSGLSTRSPVCQSREPRVYSSLAPVTSAYPQISSYRTTTDSSTDKDYSSYAITTPSTFSLSRFPQPPLSVDPSFSPPNDENVSPPLIPSFTTTAPATPPATPAVIHYRGTSFDLVNPHDSLLFHDIETPTRELDSTEYLPTLSPNDQLESAEMGPRQRHLYGDLSSAYNSIIGRTDGSSNASDLNLSLPLPPKPAMLSSGSSQYSEERGYDSKLAVQPLVVKKEAEESRFSLKQLTRSLTRKLGKSPALEQQELQDLSKPHKQPAKDHLGDDYPRPLDQFYQSPPKTTFYPIDTSMEMVETGYEHEPTSPLDSPKFSGQRISSAPLSSMLPEDFSTQIGRAEEVRTSMSEGELVAKPYYEDMASIYASSSVYDDDDGRDPYPPSLTSRRRSNPFALMSALNDSYSEDYISQRIYSPKTSARASRRVSRPLGQELLRRSLLSHPEKTDTISKFIDQYGPRERSEGSLVTHTSETKDGQTATVHHSEGTGSSDPLAGRQPSEMVSALDQFDFALQPGKKVEDGNRKPVIPATPGSPPRGAAPLAPAFEFRGGPRELWQEPSENFSRASSYGDTRNLLQMSQPAASEGLGTAANTATFPYAKRPALRDTSSSIQPGSEVQMRPLEPSSSYSQQDSISGPPTPQEALDEATKIFRRAEKTSSKDDGLPAMWTCRSSGNFLKRARGSVDFSTELLLTEDEVEDEKEDWETVGNGSALERLSMDDDSIADYSDSDGSRDSHGMLKDFSFPLPGDKPLKPYRHPSPLYAHENPFRSSPPVLVSRPRISAASDKGFRGAEASSPPSSKTAPLFVRQNAATAMKAREQPYEYTRFAPHYEFSNTETREMLNSGPNEEILYESPQGVLSSNSDKEVVHDDLIRVTSMNPPRSTRLEPPTAGNRAARHPYTTSERDNTFEKLTILGSKANLTGTPKGTGMQEVGSSVANTSSPGAMWSSSPYNDHLKPGFYAASDHTSSVTRIPESNRIGMTNSRHDRTPSECTLFPSHWNMQSVDLAGPPKARTSTSAGKRRSKRFPVSSNHPRGPSRSAVPGQTQLREMLLTPGAQIVTSAHSDQFNSFSGIAASDRPSTSNTESPLRRPYGNHGTLTSHGTFRTVVANQFSPHLLCPERALEPEKEAERHKKSWIIFGLFCILPPMLILYRWMGDTVMAHWTKGEFGHCSARPKQVALWAGVIINVGVSGIIIVSILAAHAAGAL